MRQRAKETEARRLWFHINAFRCFMPWRLHRVFCNIKYHFYMYFGKRKIQQLVQNIYEIAFYTSIKSKILLKLSGVQECESDFKKSLAPALIANSFHRRKTHFVSKVWFFYFRESFKLSERKTSRNMYIVLNTSANATFQQMTKWHSPV